MNNTLVPSVKHKTAAVQKGNFFGKENNASFFSSTAESNASFFSASPVIQRKCQHCQDEEQLQRKENTGTVAQPSPAGKYVQNISGKGTALPQSAQQFFSRTIGHDFSNVKIHTGTEAAQSAKDIHAQAYTYGSEIVFNEGKYSPDSYEGRKLLAHELAHVVQNSGTSPAILKRQAEDDPGAAPDATPVTSVSFSGTGTFTENTTDFANCEGVSVQGQTDANYSNSFSSTGTRSTSTACTDCSGADCISSSGTVVSVFNAAPAVTLPSVPSGLNPCETTAVQNFINGTLRAHEQQHVAAFNTYKGTVRTPYSYTGCVSGLDAYIQSVHDNVEVARRGRSDAASAALDANGANVFTITCDCPDPQPNPTP
ncbi:eCIS core domain-containing protein [Chitinophagaceae bacterium MMS25-I14]